MIKSILNKLSIKLPPRPTSPPLHEVDRTTLLSLGGVVLIAVIAHFSIAKPVVAVAALLVFLIKFAIIFFQRPAPARWLISILTVFSLLLILLIYGGWNGQTAGISFLVLLLALKFLESRNLRDYYVVCIILYFLAAAQFLFNSSIASIVFILVYTASIAALQLKITSPTRLPLSFAFKKSGALILKAIPLAVLLFFFFPRIQTDFGFLPSQQESNQKLTDELRSGDLASSAFDNSLAFRVTFKDAIPPHQQRYWRVKVMTQEDNFKWKIIDQTEPEIESANLKIAQANLLEGAIAYEILHEPTTDKFIPYLDYVVNYDLGEVNDDYSISMANTLNGSFSYSGGSSFSPKLALSTQINAQKLLATSSVPSKRMQTLLDNWRSKSNSPKQLLETVYAYFQNNEFSYSLKPPRLNQNRPLEDFLFSKKIGYCEHYASAFSTIMRWLDIPARVVIGFQGGYQNIAGDFLEVRYSDAHAWSEVFIDGQWTRVDATASVSPERIDIGMDALIAQWDGAQLSSNLTGRALANALQLDGYQRTWQVMSDNFKNVSYQWNKWIVNYDFDTQRELLNRLGVEHKNTLNTLIIILLGGSSLILILYFLPLRASKTNLLLEQKLYLAFVERFTKLGIEKAPSDTPNDFAAKVVARRPDIKDQVNTITQLYNQLRYEKESDSTVLNAFKQQLKAFTLKQQKQR